MQLYVSGTLNELLANSVCVMNYSSFDSFWLSPAEKAQGGTLLMLCLHLPVLLFGKTLPVTHKLVKS